MPECIFCKIVAGELPAYKIFEDDETLAFLDIHPVQRGHTLVISKHHATNIFDIAAQDWAAVQETVRNVAHAIEKSLQPDGLNLMMNNREHAGQVVDHAHVHLIPRYQGDGLKLWPHGELKDGETLAVKIHEGF